MKKRSLSLVVFAAGWLCIAGCTGPATTTPGPAPTPTGPQATMVSDSEIQAGDVEYGLPRDYIFRVQNTGGAPLTLLTTHKSCYCVSVEVPESIAPGQVGEIKIRWAPIPGSNAATGGVGNYTVTLNVQTNEPRELTFLVKANIKSKVRVILPENQSWVDFGDTALQPGTVYTRDIKVFSPELLSFNLEARCSIDGFDIVKTPLPPESRVGDIIAHSGYVVSLSTSDKLPPGYIHGEVTLTITAEGEPDRKIAADLYANRRNLEFKFTPEQVAFKKPSITEGDSKTVLIEFATPTGKETLELVSKEPKWLIVSDPKPQGDPKKGTWAMTVQIPADNPEARASQAISFMEGQIVLKSNKTAVAVRVKWEPPPPGK